MTKPIFFSGKASPAALPWHFQGWHSAESPHGLVLPLQRGWERLHQGGTGVATALPQLHSIIQG